MRAKAPGAALTPLAAGLDAEPGSTKAGRSTQTADVGAAQRTRDADRADATSVRSDSPKVAKTRRSASPLLDPTQLPLDATRAVMAGVHVGQWNRKGAELITAQQLEQALDKGDLSKVAPNVPRAMWPLVTQLAESLTLAGPLGAGGALGPAGVLGPDAQNPAYWMKTLGSWEGWSKLLATVGGPGSPAGPLGGLGALGPSYELIDHLFPGISSELRVGGIFGALGPLGPLGPLAGLGYAGGTGGHGLASDDQGRFVDGRGRERRTAPIRYGNQTKRAELFELYPESAVGGKTIHDASFAIRGTIEDGERAPDVFHFKPRRDQWLVLTAVPEKLGERFGIELYRGGERIAASEANRLVNWIQLPVKGGEELEVRLTRLPPQTAKDKSWTQIYTEAMLAPMMAWAAAFRTTNAKAEASPYRFYAVGSPAPN